MKRRDFLRWMGLGAAAVVAAPLLNVTSKPVASRVSVWTSDHDGKSLTYTGTALRVGNTFYYRGL